MSKKSHLTIEDRNAILIGIQNGGALVNIAKTLGKDPTTIKKEIIKHREISYRSQLPVECSNYQNCSILKKHSYKCNEHCQYYKKHICKRRDRTPGACNGCESIKSCRFTKYKYNPSHAQMEYSITKTESREGYNLTKAEVKFIAEIIKPLLSAGQSPYQILVNNKELNMSERSLYTYIENGVFKEYGIDAFLLRRQLSRKIPKTKKNEYKKRNDFKHLQGRKFSDFNNCLEQNPNLSIVEMDTVYNDVTNGPFIQTFKFRKAKLLIAIYQETKTAESMVNGVNKLEEILGYDLFRKHVQIILTDRGTEFTDADGLEKGEDGSKRTSIFYCDPMQSCQKPFIERNHEELRYHFPKETDLKALGLINQDILNLSLSHNNSMSLESLEGKSMFEYATFLFPDLVNKIKEFGIIPISPNSVILNPTLFKK